MCNSHKIRTIISRMNLSIICVLLLVVSYISPVTAAPSLQSKQNLCVIWLNQNNQFAVSSPFLADFQECAKAIAHDGDYARDQWAYGLWGNTQIAVRQDGSVSYREQYRSQWLYWGSIAGSTGQNQQRRPNQDPDNDGFVGTADSCPYDAEIINNFNDQDGCPDSVQQLLDLAAQDINTFWQITFINHRRIYLPPIKLVPYTTNTLRSIWTQCTGLVPNNALYCGAEHSIYYDAEWLNSLMVTYGDFAPVVVLAHEWGHAVQSQLARLGTGRFTIQQELEADCLAGAYTQYAELESQVLEEGDIEEGMEQTYNSGSNLPWFDTQAHGTSEQRLEAFIIGMLSGSDGCWGY